MKENSLSHNQSNISYISKMINLTGNRDWLKKIIYMYIAKTFHNWRIQFIVVYAVSHSEKKREHYMYLYKNIILENNKTNHPTQWKIMGNVTGDLVDVMCHGFVLLASSFCVFSFIFAASLGWVSWFCSLEKHYTSKQNEGEKAIATIRLGSDK
jgi:hypothetical protein